MSDNRIADHETRIKLLEKNDLYQDRMIEQLDRDIDTLTEMQLKTETELKLMGKDLEMINGTTSRTEDKLDKLAKQRDADHLILPLENVRWTKQQVLGIVIGIVLSFIFGAISANLGL